MLREPSFYVILPRYIVERRRCSFQRLCDWECGTLCKNYSMSSLALRDFLIFRNLFNNLIHLQIRIHTYIRVVLNYFQGRNIVLQKQRVQNNRKVSHTLVKKPGKGYTGVPKLACQTLTKYFTFI